MNLVFKNIINESPFAIIIFDATFQIIYSNKTFDKQTGYFSEEIKNKSFLDIIDENFQQKLKDFVTLPEDPLVTEGCLIDKKEKKVLTELTVVKQKKDLFTAYLKFIESCDDKVNISAAEKVEYFETLSHESNESIILRISSDNKVIFVTDSIRKVLGYTPHELLHKDALEFFHPDDVERIFQKRIHAITNKIRYYTQNFRFMHKDGNFIWMEAKINRQFDNKGNILKTIAIARDISRRIEYEDALLKAKQMAEEAVKTKNKFLSEISHDIRTPMNAIIGVSHLLLNKSPRKDQIDLINTIKFSGENLLALINDVLDFSKIQINKIEFESIDFNLSLLLKSLKIGFRTPAESKGLKFNIIAKGKVPEIVKGDSVRLNQILNNMLSNAIKFTPRGKVILEVRSEEKEESYDMLFRVIDTGIGIARDKIEKIFDPYAQADKETFRKYGGSGLGLSILKKLVELQGGSVKVESTPGEGSVFTVFLNFKKPDKKTSSAYFENRELKRIRVLYVEDVVSNQLLMKGFFSMWKISLDIAGTGEKAIELIKDRSYDLVLSDLQLPDISGYDVVERIRRLEDTYFRNLPFIAVTGTTGNKQKSKAERSGFNDFITKPINPDKLFQIISGFIDTSIKKSAINNKELGISFGYLDSLYANKPKEYHHLLLLIKIEYEKYKEALLYAIENKNIKGIRAISHKMQPNLKTLQMTEFIGALEEVKSAIRLNPDQTSTEKLSYKLMLYFDKFLQVIDEKLNSLAS